MMIWSNLKKNKCPSCSSDLSDKLEGKLFICECGFKISVKRMAEIVSKQVQRGWEREDEEMERKRQQWWQE